MQPKPAPPAHGIKQLAFQPIFGSQTRMQKTRYTAQNTAKLYGLPAMRAPHLIQSFLAPTSGAIRSALGADPDPGPQDL